MANKDRVNFVWAKSALTAIPSIPVSEVAYRDTKQTPAQMEVGQQYDTIYNSARHNQLLFLLTSVAKTLCENGIMPFLAGQEYSRYARCIFTDGKLYKASRAILANEQPYPTPRDNSGVWIEEETSRNLVPNSRRVIAGTGLAGGGPLSSDVTLSAKLDGKTTRAATGGAITVKDVAIEGDLGDLASARGQIGDYVSGGYFDFNNEILDTKNIFFGSSDSTNKPFTEGPFSLQVKSRGYDTYKWISYFLQSCGYAAIPRAAIKSSYTTDGGVTYATVGWSRLLDEKHVGDGIRVTNGIISVPEMQGATASKAGTSGLVPPATAGQQDSFLTGGGEYKTALTKISDSVNLADSKTAASAKAVKTAYDLAKSKQANLGFTPVQQSGGAGQEGQKIYIGWSSSGLKAQSGVLDLGNIVTTSAGCTKAPSAAKADYATSAGRVIKTNDSPLDFVWSGQEGQPAWVWGSNEPGTTAYVYSPARFSVNYANSAGSAATANTATGLAYAYTKNNSLAVPPGGTWFVLTWWDGDGGTAAGNWSGGQIVAGGSNIGVNNGAFALRIA